ncbi:kunitz/Bovine pancreatic trypsin inhibitor domain-containing protein [Ditylenchus destructor]|nr:kunitz/Bovine pancreatic trypsin inhibitor domain-containing protein [Ditylenchus destructor]
MCTQKSSYALSLVPFTINDPVPSNSRRSIPTYYAEEIQDNEASSRFAGMASNSVQSVFNANGNEANEANIYDENNDVSPMPDVHESVGIKNFTEVNEYDEDEGMATVFPHDPHALPELCALPEERGSCFGSHLRWFYDSEIGRCSSFMYSGCGNNANHFTSLESCERACGEYREQRKAFANRSSDNSSKLHQPHHYQRAHVETQPGPFTAESTIQLRCIADSENDASEPTWYLNEVEIDFRDLTTSSRLNLSKNGQFLVIPNAKPKHNGDYSCAIGSLGMISKPYSLVVQELPLSIHCTDKGSHSTCSLIKKTGLCSNLRYGKFCCRTCTNTSPAA